MRLKYYKPSEDLRSLLTVLAIADGVDAPVEERFPAMLPNLHIRLGGSSTYRMVGDRAIDAPRVALVGPTTAAYRMTLGAGLRVIATGFLPAGWARCVGVPAGELADTVVDGEAIWGPRAVDRLCDRLAAAGSEAAMCRIVEEFLLAAARADEDYARSPAFVVDRWLEHSRDLSLAALQSALGCGERHMRRLVTVSHGASPKTLAIKYRALRAAAALAVNGPGLLGEVMTPYADQAHFIRDFQRFTGWTPRAFLAGGSTVAAHTLAGRKRAGIVRPLSLWS
jgi:AraC-like DNA-binding protein